MDSTQIGHRSFFIFGLHINRVPLCRDTILIQDGPGVYLGTAQTLPPVQQAANVGKPSDLPSPPEGWKVKKDNKGDFFLHNTILLEDWTEAQDIKAFSPGKTWGGGVRCGQ